jgi:pullulanase
MKSPYRLLLLSMVAVACVPTIAAPLTVTAAGSFQSEAGCPGDWQPECATTQLQRGTTDLVWRRTFTLPAGAYEYKIAIDGSWDENYGAGATLNGPNIALSLPAGGGDVRFYYDEVTHWATDNQQSRIITAAGSFQSELGCAGDWSPDCLQSWLQDIDGDGTYTFMTNALPMGMYEVKAALNEAWDENYGLGGVANGANIAFSVTELAQSVLFSFVSATNVLTVTVSDDNGGNPVSEPAASALALMALGLLATQRQRSRRRDR